MKKSKRTLEIEDRKAADPIAQKLGRVDIDYSSDDLPTAPRTVAGLDLAQPYMGSGLCRTWKEFKVEVESLGVRDDDLISYIDISYKEPLEVQRSEKDLAIQS